MDEFKFADHTVHSRRYPPPEAWVDPERWLDLGTGLAKGKAERLPVPYANGLIDIDVFISSVSSELFQPSYKWPYTPNYSETRPDNHHFYYTSRDYKPDHYGGDERPEIFRQLPVNIGRMPRQFHNAIHDFTDKPDVPNEELMHDYIHSYSLAHMAFKNLYISAKHTLDAMGLFPVRRQNIVGGLVTPKHHDDAIGEEILRQRFKKHFSSYQRAVESYLETEDKQIFYKEHETLKVTRPQIVVRKIGAVVSRRSVGLRLNNFPDAA
jgi:hypothetical protein